MKESWRLKLRLAYHPALVRPRQGARVCPVSVSSDCGLQGFWRWRGARVIGGSVVPACSAVACRKAGSIRKLKEDMGTAPLFLTLSNPFPSSSINTALQRNTT